MLKDKFWLCVPWGLAQPLEGQKHGLAGRESKPNWAHLPSGTCLKMQLVGSL